MPATSAIVYGVSMPHGAFPISECSCLPRACAGPEHVGGWHTFRHSYKSWMSAAKISPAQMKDLMCHSDIETR